METTLRERLFAGLGTAIIVALLGYALLLGLHVSIAMRSEQVVDLLDIRTPPPPPPHPKKPVEHPHSTKASGAASPRNLRNKATPVVAPPPIVKLPPPPPPLVIAPKPGTGMAASNGASNRPGPGEGAGGEGNGTGAGGEGDGDGDGIAPREIEDKLKFSYLSPDVERALSADHQWHDVGVRYSIEISGRVTHCVVTKPSGIAGLDAETCQAIEQHFRYHPARDPNGQRWVSTMDNDEAWRSDVDEQKTPER